MGIRSLFCLTAFAVVTAGPARAEVVFNNFGPGDSFNQFLGRTTAGPSTGIVPPFNSAYPFTPANTTFFDAVEVALTNSSGPNTVKVQLRADNPAGGGIPGTVLEEIVFTGLPTGFGNGEIFKGDSVLHPELAAATTYWIAVLAGTDFTSAVWLVAAPPQFGDVALSTDLGGTWQRNPFGQAQQGAFRVTGSSTQAVIPEPAGATLASLGLVGAVAYLWGRRRRLL